MTRTTEEIEARILSYRDGGERAGNDFFGKRQETLLLSLPWESTMLQEVLEPGVTKEAWEKTTALDHARDYVDFAMSKIVGQRGLSSARAFDAYSEWLWLLADDAAVEEYRKLADADDYGLAALGFAAATLGLADAYAEATRNYALDI